MPRVKQIALSDPPSQEPLEGGSDSALPFTSNTVASWKSLREGHRQGRCRKKLLAFCESFLSHAKHG